MMAALAFLSATSPALPWTADSRGLFPAPAVAPVAVPPLAPCAWAQGDWNLLFDAVMQRLRDDVLGRPSCGAAAERAWLDCLLSLQLLHAALGTVRPAASVR